MQAVCWYTVKTIAEIEKKEEAMESLTNTKTCSQTDEQTDKDKLLAERGIWESDCGSGRAGRYSTRQIRQMLWTRTNDQAQSLIFWRHAIHSTPHSTHNTQMIKINKGGKEGEK